MTDTGCWEWSGSRHRQGYGIIRVDGRTEKTHRAAYETWVGPIPDGLLIRHKCDNPPCINPDHLETGTQADNVADMAERGRRFVSRLSADERFDIAWLRGMGARGTDIASEFGISNTRAYELTRTYDWGSNDSV